MEEEDPRFNHVSTDPRFRTIPKSKKKHKIEKRFGKVFKDSNFQLTHFYDKRGRPVTAGNRENLERFYDMSTSESDDDDATDVGKESKSGTLSKQKKEVDKADSKKVTRKSKKGMDQSPSPSKKSTKKSSVKKNTRIRIEEDKDGDQGGEEEDDDVNGDGESDLNPTDVVNDDEDDTDEEAGPVLKKTIGQKALEPDYARGEGLVSSSSDDDSSSLESEDEDAVVHDDHYWGEMAKEAVETEEMTSRLALCNMDWDRIKAQDIFMSLNSMKPQGGLIKCVKIYPSDYGLERMKEENQTGPQELTKEPKTGAVVKAKKGETSKDTEDLEKLRLYQLNRLKYYYAVIECDSAETAGKVYHECNGVEYESSSNVFDLRFIPEDMTFDVTPSSECTGQPGEYKPNLFVNTALNQSKQVDCTWDETDKSRLAITMRRYKENELDTVDFSQFLAEHSDEEGEDESNEGDEVDPYAGIEFDGPTVDEWDSEVEESQLQAYRKLADGFKERPTRDGAVMDSDVDSDDDDDDASQNMTATVTLGAADEGGESDSEGNEQGDMETVWEPGLKEAASEGVSEGAKKEEERGLTPWDAYLEKKAEKGRKKLQEKQLKKQEEKQKTNKSNLSNKQKKKERKAAREKVENDPARQELSLLLMDGPEEQEHEGKKHFTLKEIQDSEKKKKKKFKGKKKKAAEEEAKADDFQIDLTDGRFSAVYSDPHFNIEPSAPDFKMTNDMEKVIQKKLKRKMEESDNLERESSQRKKVKSVPSEGQNLQSLVQSVKDKTRKMKSSKSNSRAGAKPFKAPANV